MKILLFDIDGTLMLSGGAGRRAIDRAFFELYGISDAFGEVVPDGNTDPKIFSEIMDNHDVAVADRTAAFAVLAERYAEHIIAHFPAPHDPADLGRYADALAPVVE